MTLLGVFETAAGGVTGRDHLRARRDGQDGHARLVTDDVALAVVTDGCSSGRACEVGARLGAAWVAEIALRTFRTARDPREAARAVTRDLVCRLEWTARSLSPEGGIDPSVVGELLLFGFLAAVVTREHAIVFGVGDGVAWVDGRVVVIDPGPENAPEYAAYALLGRVIEPRILYAGQASSTTCLAVATDGASELLAADADVRLSDLVQDDRVIENPSWLRKRLVVLSDRGKLFDDTTVALVRRRSS